MRGLRIADLQEVRDAARARRRPGHRLILALASVLMLAGCAPQTPQQPSTGVAFAGPSTLNLRKDIASKSAPAGTAKHGDRLEVLETRRRFVKVRTPQGVEGWTDVSLLLTPQQMEDIRGLAQSVAKLPTQGTATVFDALNVHAEPARQSASFFQIPENGSVEVIGHRITPRVQQSAPIAPSQVRRTTPSSKKKKESKRALPPPPTPPPPSVPKDWDQLSHPRAPELPGYAPPVAAPIPLDDWTLIRTRDGKAGWVLSRMLTMAIPDEVAQYAEGHRITAYLPLDDVNDREKGEVKHNWLWTTIGTGQHPYEFDSFRVFVWSLKRHRYETAYIERNVKGYYPVGTEPSPDKEGKAFTVVLEDKDGKLYRRTYAFNGYRVRMISKIPYQPGAALPEMRASRSFDPVPAQAPAESGWREKLKDLRKRWIGR